MQLEVYVDVHQLYHDVSTACLPVGGQPSLFSLRSVSLSSESGTQSEWNSE